MGIGCTVRPAARPALNRDPRMDRTYSLPGLSNRSDATSSNWLACEKAWIKRLFGMQPMTSEPPGWGQQQSQCDPIPPTLLDADAAGKSCVSAFPSERRNRPGVLDADNSRSEASFLQNGPCDIALASSSAVRSVIVETCCAGGVVMAGPASTNNIVALGALSLIMRAYADPAGPEPTITTSTSEGLWLPVGWRLSDVMRSSLPC